MSRLPSLKPREVAAILKRDGFLEVRQSGSHVVLRHPDGREVVIAMHARELKRPTLMAIVRQAGYTPETFLRLL